MRLSSTSLLALACSAIYAVPAHADDAALDAANDDSRTIIVTGTSEGYIATNSVTATKTDTPLIDIPQTINVVTREQLDDQSHHSLADVLRYVPGTTVGQGEGNRDQITLRGQNTTADFFLDGVRDDVQYYRGLYNIERVEILKGPYALIFRTRRRRRDYQPRAEIAQDRSLHRRASQRQQLRGLRLLRRSQRAAE